MSRFSKILKLTTTVIGVAERVRGAQERARVVVFPINLRGGGDLRVRAVAYLAMRMPTTSRALDFPRSLSRVRLISIARFDWKGLYIRMTCGWLISSYAKLRRHVGWDDRGRGGGKEGVGDARLGGRMEERRATRVVSPGLPMLVASKSLRDSK